MDRKDNTLSPYSLSGLVVTKSAYQQVSSEFHPFHRHDLNAFLHFWTTGLGIWGAIQLAVLYDCEYVVYAYATIIALTCPLLTSALHTIIIAAFISLPSLSYEAVPLPMDSLYICIAAIVLGYGLQDLSHYVCMEATYMESYIGAKPYMLVIHSIWLMPLVIDSVLMRYCFLPILVTRNRNVITQVASKKNLDELRSWIHTNIPESKETTHVWPHAQEETSSHVKALEDDAAIYSDVERQAEEGNH